EPPGQHHRSSRVAIDLPTVSHGGVRIAGGCLTRHAMWSQVSHPVRATTVADQPELPGTLADEPASPSLRRAIGVCCVAYRLATLAVLPRAHLPGPIVPAVTTTFGAGVLIADLCTSFLLLVQFRIAPSWSMLLLAAAYFYSGAMAFLHVLTFPGA